ncbi:RICIN domain-containing protein [Chloroflexi bacterium TSY]|nr:RICIN domain-containing protein [Chloroflexi bacterium TSY]
MPQSNIVRIPPTPPVAPKLSSPEGTIQIVAKHSEKCLDVDVSNSDTNGMSNGTLVQQWDCLGQDQNNQLWSLISVGDYFQIVAKHSEKCLDVDVSDSDTNGMSNGTLVQQWDCLGQDQENQLWSLISVGDYFQIVAKHSEKCLDVDISNSDTNGMIDGTPVQQWECLGQSQNNQL